MITREQVADLRPGDVVEIRRPEWVTGTALRGPLVDRGDDGLYLADELVQWPHSPTEKRVAWMTHTDAYLTVVSRAPRLYVNHDRAEPAVGDVVRDEMTGDVYVREHNTVARPDPFWWCPVRGRSRRDDCINLPLTLLVDGETGQAVTS